MTRGLHAGRKLHGPYQQTHEPKALILLSATPGRARMGEGADRHVSDCLGHPSQLGAGAQLGGERQRACVLGDGEVAVAHRRLADAGGVGGQARSCVLDRGAGGARSPVAASVSARARRRRPSPSTLRSGGTSTSASRATSSASVARPCASSTLESVASTARRRGGARRRLSAPALASRSAAGTSRP
jgi:hypothetical protein